MLGTDRTGDANISVLETDLERFTGDEETYLAVFTRTPHNDVILPLMSLTASLERGGDTLFETSLAETLDHEFGHHYGLVVEGLEEEDQVTVSVDGLPQIARHDGYETAFFEFEDVVFDV